MKRLQALFALSLILNLTLSVFLYRKHREFPDRQPNVALTPLAFPPPSSEAGTLAEIGPPGTSKGISPPIMPEWFGPPPTLTLMPSAPVAADCEGFVDFMLGASSERFSPTDIIDSISKCESLPEALAEEEAAFRRDCARAKKFSTGTTELGPPTEDTSPFLLDMALSGTAVCSMAVEKLQAAIARNARGNKPLSEVTDVRVLVRLQKTMGNTIDESEAIARRIAELMPNDIHATVNYLDQLGTKAMFDLDPKSAEKHWKEVEAWVEKGRSLDPSHPYFEEMDLWTRTHGFTENVAEAIAEHERRYPNSGYGLFQAGIAAANAGDEKEAEKYFQRAIEKEPRDFRYRTNLDKIRRHEPVDQIAPSGYTSASELLPPLASN